MTATTTRPAGSTPAGLTPAPTVSGGPVVIATQARHGGLTDPLTTGSHQPQHNR